MPSESVWIMLKKVLGTFDLGMLDGRLAFVAFAILFEVMICQ